MKSREKTPVMHDYEVRHPDYPTVIVSSIGPDSATIAATTKWGVREEWGQIASYCSVRKLGVTARSRCRRCNTEIGAPGLCMDCERAEAQYRRELAKVRSTDRRAEYRGA